MTESRGVPTILLDHYLNAVIGEIGDFLKYYLKEYPQHHDKSTATRCSRTEASGVSEE